MVNYADFLPSAKYRPPILWGLAELMPPGCMVSTGMIPRLCFASTRKVWTSSVVCTSAEVISTLAQVTMEPCSGGRPLRRRRLCL